MDYETAAEIYQDLRRRGQVYIRADQAGLISGVRRLAKKDDLAVSQYRGSLRNLSRQQARQRPYNLGLTQPGSDLIYAPDAPVAV